eukprot:TRINITY_DN2335_c8_g1_i1.p1 TRINITY_DN2335_c8_g1~~TRINITY_DN2335_c8_g1_i1.p1  ORF type:complete len:199 (+),score=12.16 TRINITY_DN2335_c8_g1_i1:72-599(+)
MVGQLEPVVLSSTIFAVIGWTLTVVTLAEKTSNYTVWNGGCGIFECDTISLSWGCGERDDHVMAAKAFGCLTAISTGISVLFYVLAIQKGGSTLAQYLKYLHAAGVIFSFITWVAMASIYSTKMCSRRISDHRGAAVGYGVFLMVSVTVIETTLAVINFKSAALAGLQRDFASVR